MSGSFLNTAPLPAFSQLNRIRIMRLYRRALKLQMSWTPRYDIFRGEAMEIRRRFDRNMHVTDPRMIAKLVNEAEDELYRHRHPDPYIRIPRQDLPRFGAVEWLMLVYSSYGPRRIEMGTEHSSTEGIPNSQSNCGDGFPNTVPCADRWTPPISKKTSPSSFPGITTKDPTGKSSSRSPSPWPK